MTANDLIAAFEELSDAPEGVKRLRELVLQLAVRGQLVPQDAREAPANTPQEKGPARQNPAHSLAVESPFPPPPGWVWTTVSSLGDTSPRNKVPDDAVVGFVPMAVVPKDYGGSLLPETRRWGDIKKGFTHIADGDIAIAKITPCFQNGKACVVSGLPGGVGAGTTELLVLRPHPGLVDPRYALAFFKSPDFVKGGVETFTGTAGQQRVSNDYFRCRPFPLPPLSEQRRIVARVDELMVLLDRLETARAVRDDLRLAARDAALAALRDADDVDAVEAAWGRIAGQMTALFVDPSDVGPLRQTVLQLAVMGRLVGHVANDEPASSLLVRTVAEMRQRREAGATRVGDDPGGYDRAEELPSGWCWAPLQQLVQFIDYRGNTPPKVPSGVRLITAKNIKRGFISPHPEEFVTDSTYEEWMTRGFPKIGDVLFTTEAPMGHAALVKSAERFALAQRTINLQPYSNFSGSFLLVVLLSPWFEQQLAERATGMTATGIKAAKLRQIRVPVPPVQEQHRIVAKVDELTAMCDALEARLATARDLHQQFAAAAVHHLDM